MSIKTRLASPLPYALWLIASAILLAGARAADPYIFGFAAFAAAGVSAVLVVVAACVGLRPFLWSLAAGIPTVLSFALLSTYKWA
jgi:hypothetical protein